jgi:hypothetical protein
MKRLLLIALIFTTPAFAQEVEEERQVEIRMEALGGGVEVAAGGSDTDSVGLAGYKDKSVWFFVRKTATYCWVDEDNEPHCKEVKPE